MQIAQWDSNRCADTVYSTVLTHLSVLVVTEYHFSTLQSIAGTHDSEYQFNNAYIDVLILNNIILTR